MHPPQPQSTNHLAALLSITDGHSGFNHRFNHPMVIESPWLAPLPESNLFCLSDKCSQTPGYSCTLFTQQRYP